jgi:hypothetical protein
MTEDSYRDTVGPLEPAELARVRVRAGMRLLDAKRPGWRDSIDPERLNMESGFRCILGQVYAADVAGPHQAGFGVGCSELGLKVDDEGSSRLDSARLVALGFDADALEEDGPDYPTLRDAWVDALADRMERTEA